MPKATVFELNLLENGLDFVTSGIEIYFSRKSPKPYSHKYAILHVFSGMLLLLKERLARIDPLLVFKRRAEAGQPGAKTTDFDKTFRRLEAQGIRIDPRKLTVLKEIRNLRNAIEHYRFELPLQRSEEVIAEMVSFVYNFCRDQLNVRIDDRLSPKALERFYRLKEIGDRLYEEAERNAIAEAEAEDRYLQEFESKYIDKYSEMSSGELLQHAATVGATTVENVSRFRCPRCDEKTIVFLEVGVCINSDCRATCRLDNCRACFKTMVKSSLGFCDECLSP